MEKKYIIIIVALFFLLVLKNQTNLISNTVHTKLYFYPTEKLKPTSLIHLSSPEIKYFLSLCQQNNQITTTPSLKSLPSRSQPLQGLWAVQPGFTATYTRFLVELSGGSLHNAMVVSPCHRVEQCHPVQGHTFSYRNHYHTEMFTYACKQGWPILRLLHCVCGELVYVNSAPWMFFWGFTVVGECAIFGWDFFLFQAKKVVLNSFTMDHINLEASIVACFTRIALGCPL